MAALMDLVRRGDACSRVMYFWTGSDIRCCGSLGLFRYSRTCECSGTGQSGEKLKVGSWAGDVVCVDL